MKNVLWYKESAAVWEEALPLGNGNIGAMVFGGTAVEQIGLNDDTLWSGYPKDKKNPDCPEYFRRVQDTLLSGRIREAEAMANCHVAGCWSESYQPLGDLFIEAELPGEVSDYRRELNIGDAVATTSFRAGAVRVERKAFVSHPAKALVVSIEASAPVSMRIRLTSPHPSSVSAENTDGAASADASRAGGNGRLVISGRAPEQAMPDYYSCDDPVIYDTTGNGHAERFTASLRVSADGAVEAFSASFAEPAAYAGAPGEAASDACTGRETAADVCTLRADTKAEAGLMVRDSTRVLLVLTTATSFVSPLVMPDGDEKALLSKKEAAAAGKDLETLISEHIADHRSLFDRVDLDLSHDPGEELPIPERMARVDAGEEDRDLAALLFRYGRYLMIASSRPGTTATNLQGIWNRHVRAPWSSNYTININTEMNYWPAEVCNLPELTEPLFTFLKAQSVSGARVARDCFGAGGWASFHNADLWAHAVPVGFPNHDGDVSGFSFWPMSPGWLSEHLYEHYRFTKDTRFLAEEALPIMLGAAEFYLDYMREDADGNLVTALSTSPENAYFNEEGEYCHMDPSPMMDRMILRELFGNILKGAEIVGLEDPRLDRIREALPKLKGAETGPDGRLLEYTKAYAEPEPEHRHLSHLYGLYPADLISVSKTPELAEACRRSLLGRGAYGTGWSLAWKVCLYARLGEGEYCYKMIRKALHPVTTTGYDYSRGGGCYISLLGAHPPFQIDGNFGITAGIAEMLIRSTEEETVLLPALPASWRDGYVRGLRTRGGKTADITWKDGKITESRIY